MHQNNFDSNTELKPNFSYLIWTFFALALAAMNLHELILTEKLSRAVLTLSWLCLALSWFSKPIFLVRSNTFSGSIQLGALHPKVSELVWASVTSAGLLLLLFGIVLRFLFSA